MTHTTQRRQPGDKLSIAEVIEELGVSRSTFYDWRMKRKAPRCIKLPNGDLRIRRAVWMRGWTPLRKGRPDAYHL